MFIIFNTLIDKYIKFNNWKTTHSDSYLDVLEFEKNYIIMVHSLICLWNQEKSNYLNLWSLDNYLGTKHRLEICKYIYIINELIVHYVHNNNNTRYNIIILINISSILYYTKNHHSVHSWLFYQGFT